MKIRKDISNADLFKIILDNINWTNLRQQKFYKSTYAQFVKSGKVSPKQRSVLFKIASRIIFKSDRDKNYGVYMSDQAKKLYRI